MSMSTLLKKAWFVVLIAVGTRLAAAQTPATSDPGIDRIFKEARVRPGGEYILRAEILSAPLPSEIAEQRAEEARKKSSEARPVGSSLLPVRPFANTERFRVERFAPVFAADSALYDTASAGENVFFDSLGVNADVSLPGSFLGSAKVSERPAIASSPRKHESSLIGSVRVGALGGGNGSARAGSPNPTEAVVRVP